MSHNLTENVSYGINSTRNISNAASGFSLPGPASSLHYLDFLVVFLLTVVFLVGVIGNSLVIYVFGIKRRLKRSRYDQLVLCLGTADFFCSLFVPTLFIYGTIVSYRRWDFGWLGCKILPAILPVNVSTSEGILLLLSFVRYRSIVSPFKTKLSKTSLKICTLLVVTAAWLLASPYIFSLELVKDSSFHVYTCIPSKARWHYALTYSIINLLRDFAATVVLGVMSYRMSKALEYNQGLQDSYVTLAQIQSRIKAKKLLNVIVPVFSVCVIPVDVFQVLLYILSFTGFVENPSVYRALLMTNTFLNVLQAANSATNVVIYARMYEKFRKNVYCLKKRERRAFSLHSNHTFRTVAYYKKQEDTVIAV